jgi:hypothetical protein
MGRRMGGFATSISGKVVSMRVRLRLNMLQTPKEERLPYCDSDLAGGDGILRRQ